MRIFVLGALLGAIGLVKTVASAPQISYGSSIKDLETCEGNPATVFVTLPGVSTITIHDAPVSTVYLSVPSYAVASSIEPITTLTRVYTSTRTNTVKYATRTMTKGDEESANLTYQTTVTHTAVVETVYMTYTAIPSSSAGPLSFMVSGGSTYWAGGISPPAAAATASYVVVTSAVTVMPVNTPVSQADHTRTTTIHTTIINGHSTTITMTIKTRTGQTAANGTVIAALSFTGTANTFTGMGPGGWNASSGFGYGIPKSTGQPVFITEQSSYDLYTSRSSERLTASAAKSGFAAFSTYSAAHAISTPTSTYANSTTNAPVSFTHSANGIATSLPVSFNGWVNSTSCSESAILTIGSRNLTYSIKPTGIDPRSSALPSGYVYTPLDINSTATPSTTFQAGHLSVSNSISNATSFVNSPTSTADGIFPSSTAPKGVSASLSTSSVLGEGIFNSSATPTYAANPSSGSLSSSIILTSEISSSSSIVSSSSSLFSGSVSLSSTSFSIESVVTESYTSMTRTSALSSSSALATPTYCGEIGDFTLNFDDIPPLVSTNDTFDTVQPAPLFSPYHQFGFSDGFTVVPPPRDPYLPSSKPLLTEFIPNFNVLGNSTQSGPNTKESGFSGDIGNGDHGLTGCFAFNFYGAAFGCDSRGPDCGFTFTGYRYNRATKETNEVSQQTYSIPACPALADCDLTPVKFANEFMELDSIRINVTVAGEPKIWWMDDLQLGWFNNTCTAGLCRINTHIH